MNEKRNVLEDHEFMTGRPKKTQDILDLDEKWQGRLKKNNIILKKGYGYQ